MPENTLTIITGASRGLGRALTELYAKQRHKVLAIARDQVSLKAIASAHPDFISILPLDLAKPNQTRKITDHIAKGVTINIIHCAAIAPTNTLKQATVEDLKNTMMVNTFAPILVTEQIAKQNQINRVLFISSGLAHTPLPGLGAYCMSKAALHMAWKIFNSEGNKNDTLYGSLIPGVFDTDMQKVLRESPEENLPCADLFKDFKSNSNLRDVDEVAKFVFTVMQNSTDEDFCHKEWNIDNKQ